MTEEKIETDVLVIGAGLAGVFKIILPEDDIDAEVKRYAFGYAFSEGLYDEEWLNVCLSENYDRVLDMEKYGVDWHKTPERKGIKWG